MTDTSADRLDTLTINSFAGRVGERFVLEDEPQGYELVLSACEPRGQGPTREAFSLLFVGPGDRVFPQRIYRLRHTELGVLELFLVPVGNDAGGTRYEAMFS
jgi:hypothetical protein